MSCEIVFRVGKGIDLPSILRPNLRRHADRAAYFLDVLRRKTRVNGHPIRLSSQHLAKIMGRVSYASIVNDLVLAGIVQKSRSYKPGQRSKEYTLSQRYLALEKVEYRPTNRYLIQNLSRFYESRKTREEFRPTDPTLAFLHSQLCRLRFDEARVRGLVDAIEDSDRRWSVRTNVESIRHNRVTLREDNDGRVHHAVTRLPKAIRQTLTVDGESIYEVDVVNCQPLLVPVIYGVWINSDRCFARIPLSSFSRDPEFFARRWEKGESPLCITPDSATEFSEWCERGEVYERLAEMAGWAMVDQAERESVKTRIFRDLLYADASGLRRPDNTLAKVFRERFPDLFAMLWSAQQRTLVDAATRRRVKSTRHAPSGRSSIVRKSVLPFYMQRIESQIVVRGVVPRWMNEKPGRFLATIHDSILVAESDAEDAAQMLRDEFAAVGLFPQVKVSKGLVTA